MVVLIQILGSSYTTPQVEPCRGLATALSGWCAEIAVVERRLV